MRSARSTATVCRSRGSRSLAGASGGPKWLVLAGFDRYLASEVIPRLAAPVTLLGSSIGAWRHVCLAQRNPLAAVTAFTEAYIEQRYPERPSAREVTEKSYAILGELLGENGAADSLAHPVLHQSIVTVLCRALTASDRPLMLAGGLAAAAFANFLRRDWLGAFFSRAVFHDTRSQPAWLTGRDFATQSIALTRDNLIAAIVASGSIPFVLEGVRSPPGAPDGVYRDGGVVDYHLDLPLSDIDGVTLYPHFYPTVTPGWFDKRLLARHGTPANFRRVLMIAPSPAMVARLPGGRIPDRSDFTTMTDDARIAAWRQVVAESQRLADEFHDLRERGRLEEAVEPLSLRRTAA